ncbi:MAG: RHS repeat-associated core domain-containing protein [Bacteroidota bacterium]
MIVTKPTRVSAELGYNPNFISQTTLPSSGQLSGQAYSLNGNERYPYYRTVYERSPLSRPLEQGLPGSDFRIGQSTARTTRVSYYNNSTSSQSMGTPVGGSSFPSNSYGVVRTTDPDGHGSWVMTDKLGNVIQERAEKTGSQQIKTTYEYDKRNRLVKIYHPNYFSPPSGTDKNAFVTHYTYDHWGQVIEKKTTDAGTSRYVYDKAGRLRFMQDARGIQEGHILYWHYDQWGRVTEEGYWNQSWNRSTLQSKADDLDWPNGSRVWRKKYKYDDHEERAYQRGQLTAVRVNSDSNGDTEVIERWRYDPRGNVTSHGTKAADFDSEYRYLDYRYDNQGQIIEVEYDNELEVKFRYDRLGRMSKVGSSSISDVYARYDYDGNGRLAREKLNRSLNQSYSYNSPGWLTKIRSSEFEENLSYNSNGYSGSEYYSGLIARAEFDFKGHHTNYNYTFRYDKLGQLEVANHPEKAYDLGVGGNLQYDANGNLTRARKGNSTKYYKYHGSTNRLKNTKNNSSQDYRYDANGNITRAPFQEIDYDRFFNLPTRIEQRIPDGETVDGVQLNTPPPPGSPTIREHDNIQYNTANQKVYEKLSTASGSWSTYYHTYIYGAGGQPFITAERYPHSSGTDYRKSYHIYGATGLIAIHKYDPVLLNTNAIATLEPALSSTEAEVFTVEQGQLVDAQLFNHTPNTVVAIGGTPNASYSLRLAGSPDNTATGLSAALPVNTGDTIRLAVYAKYPDPRTPAQLSALVAQLGSAALQLPIGGGLEAAPNLATSGTEPLLALPDGKEASEVPQAGLNYILFDTAGQVVDYGYQLISTAAAEDGSDRPHEELRLETVVTQPGYLHAYVSNESIREVFFDDMQVHNSSSSQTHFMLKDHLGSVRMVVNEQNNIIGAYDYDAWGKTIYSSGTNVTQRFQGQDFVNSQVYDFGARLYDPTVGIFYATDPANQFHNPYAGIGNNPVNMVDPDGEFAWLIPIAIGAAVNVATNWSSISSAGSFGQGLAQAAGFAGVGALQGASTLLGPAGFALGGAIGGVGNTWIQGGSGSQILQSGIVGSISGLAGGVAGTAAVSGLGSLASPVLDGLAKGAVGGAAGGFLGGGIASGITGGNFLDGALQGAWQGAALGAAAGGAARVWQASRQGFNPWTGERVRPLDVPKKVVPSGSEWWVEGSDRSRLNTLKPGRYAVEGVEYNSTSRNFPSDIRSNVNNLGKKHGCHTCGIKTPDGTYIPDHQPPIKINTELKFTLYPHCLGCSRMQGGQIRQLKSKP